VAHDFNNLIGVILNYAEFVGDEIDTAAQASGAPQWTAAANDVNQIRRTRRRAHPTAAVLRPPGGRSTTLADSGEAIADSAVLAISPTCSPVWPRMRPRAGC
jgi:hypothetical protein